MYTRNGGTWRVCERVHESTTTTITTTTISLVLANQNVVTRNTHDRTRGWHDAFLCDICFGLARVINVCNRIYYIFYIYIYTHTYICCSVDRCAAVCGVGDDWCCRDGIRHILTDGQTQNIHLTHDRRKIRKLDESTRHILYLSFDICDMYWWWDGLLYNTYIGRSESVGNVCERESLTHTPKKSVTISIIESRTTKNDSYGFFFLSFSLVLS